MQNSYPVSWKELYLQTLLGSDPQELTELVLATEQAIVLRSQEVRRPSRGTQRNGDRQREFVGD
jgi:hypothetical protein